MGLYFVDMAATKAFARNDEICENCRWRSDEFTSVCCNSDSRHCADFVCSDDTCDAFERREDKK